jgi:peptidase inhibitor family I36
MRRIAVIISMAFVACVSAAIPAASAASPGPVRVLQAISASEVGILAFSDCPAGRSCFWTGDNATGSRWDAPSCGIFVLSSAYNNNIESVRNRGGGDAVLWNNGNQTDRIRTIFNNGANVELTESQDNSTSAITVLC